MTDSAGTPAEPEQPDEDEPPTGTPEPEGTTGTATEKEECAPAASTGTGTGSNSNSNEESGRAEASDGGRGGNDGDGAGDDSAGATGGAPHKRHWVRWTALGAAVVVLAAAGVGWSLYKKLDSNITTDEYTARELEKYEKERPTPVVRSAQNILLIGSDTREGKGNDKYGQDGGSQRSDTTILLHLSADRESATAVSIPRDLMVDIPACTRKGGDRTEARFAQFNWAYQFAGASCTIRTVEKLTDIRIDHHMVVDFKGFKKMVDAVDGVRICLKEPVDDKDAHLKLPAGEQTLDGEQALGYVRARKSIGRGSDTERMDRQQQFLGALVDKVQSNGVLLNPARLYPVLDAATSSLTTDPGLNSLRDLYELVRRVRDIPTDNVQFLTVPRQPYANDPNRDELVQPEADELFELLREDAPLRVSPDGTREGDEEKGDEDESGRAESAEPDSPASSPPPTFRGTTAAPATCE
ncbi:LCP family protein [Streptomyces sp. GC420]|uniref:LCP family protein n=1 Tax=Streptomyces sp. GC420 TaxID=2697568 RepID=UPI0037D9DF3A